jgi:hypothetical protein
MLRRTRAQDDRRASAPTTFEIPLFRCKSSALTSWPSINIPAVATFSALFARLDPDPRVRGKQFEHFCKWFLANDPTCKNTNP